MRSTIASSLGLLLLAFAVPTAAQPSDQAVAEALFRDGKRLLADGNVAEACRKFEASYQKEAALGTLLNMALCHEREGKITLAWTELNQSLAKAKEARLTDRKNAERTKIAEEHIAALERKLARVVLTVSGANTADLKVELDGAKVEPGAFGTKIPVMPGEHTARASAPGKDPWKSRLTINEGETVTLVVPPLAAHVAPPPPRADWKRPAGIAALGAGAIGLGLGIGFGVAALNENAQLMKVCGAKRVCPDSARPDVASALTHAKIADAGVTLGLVFAAAGAVLLLLPRAAPPRVAVVPVFGPGVLLGVVGGSL